MGNEGHTRSNSREWKDVMTLKLWRSSKNSCWVLLKLSACDEAAVIDLFSSPFRHCCEHRGVVKFLWLPPLCESPPDLNPALLLLLLTAWILSSAVQDIGPIGPDRNWKGIGISLLVILVVLSLIGLSIVLLSKGKLLDTHTCISE